MLSAVNVTTFCLGGREDIARGRQNKREKRRKEEEAK
jgi:hypothetical protein